MKKNCIRREGFLDNLSLVFFSFNKTAQQLFFYKFIYFYIKKSWKNLTNKVQSVS